MTPHANFAPLLERFFTQRLITQKQVSPHTIASYRDTFRLFLQFARRRTHKAPSDLAFSDISVDLIETFLTDLEKSRGISARSRNLRLSALRSFFRYALYYEPMHAGRIQQILAIPATTRPHAGGLSHATGSGGAPRRAKYPSVERSARSRATARRISDRNASL